MGGSPDHRVRFRRDVKFLPTLHAGRLWPGCPRDPVPHRLIVPGREGLVKKNDAAYAKHEATSLSASICGLSPPRAGGAYCSCTMTRPTIIRLTTRGLRGRSRRGELAIASCKPGRTSSCSGGLSHGESFARSHLDPALSQPQAVRSAVSAVHHAPGPGGPGQGGQEDRGPRQQDE